MTFSGRLLFIVFFLAITLFPVRVFAAGVDTDFRFSTIETKHFSIHFHQGLEVAAEKTADIAEAYHAFLTEIFQWTPREKTQVILMDNSDFANGSATTLPYNIIRLRMVPPSVDSTLGEYDDWLRELFVHEYTHILTLDTSKGANQTLRRIFGKPLPVFSDFFSLLGALFITPPNFFLPSWWKEGVATWAETEFTGAGRGRSSWFEMIYRAAVLNGTLPEIDEINGDLPNWPAGKMPYIFGLSLFRFMADRYGTELPGELTGYHASKPPYLTRRLSVAPFKSRQTYLSLYHEMTDEIKRVQREKIEEIKARPLTDIQFLDTPGESLLFPEYSPDGRYIAVTRRDPHNHQAVLLLNRDGSLSGLSFERHSPSGSASWSADSAQLLFSEASVVNGFNVYEDIFSYDLKKNTVSRVTYGMRLRDPAVKPGKAQGKHPVFAAVRSMRGGESLVIVNFDVDSSRYVGERVAGSVFERIADPAWSPDGRFIAYEAKENEGESKLCLYDTQKGVDRTLYGGDFSIAHPAWSPDGKNIIFVSDETGVFNLFTWSMEKSKLFQLTNVVGGLFQPAVSPEGDEIIFSSYYSGGMKIGKIPFSPVTWMDEPGPVIKKSWTEKDDSKRRVRSITERLKSSEASTDVHRNKIRPYSPLETLYPRFWIPSFISDHKGVGGGIFTAGGDAVGYHAYFLKAEYAPGSGTLYYDAAYRFDALYPSFIFKTSSLPVRYSSFTGDDYYELNRTSIIQTVIPVNRIDSGYSFTFGYHFQEQSALSRLRNGRFQGIKVFQGTRDNIFAGISFSNMERYPYSVSSERGRSISFVTRYFSEKLRNGLDGREYQLSWSESVPADRKIPHTTFQLRLRGAVAEGRQTAQHSFQMGGHGGESFFSVRGYPARSFRGRYITTASLEYRFPVMYILRGQGTMPLFLDRLHGAFFIDSGEIWDDNGSFSLGHMKTGTGIELRLDMLIGYMQKLTPTLGFAHGFNFGGGDVFYFFMNYGFGSSSGGAGIK